MGATHTSLCLALSHSIHPGQREEASVVLILKTWKPLRTLARVGQPSGGLGLNTQPRQGVDLGRFGDGWDGVGPSAALPAGQHFAPQEGNPRPFRQGIVPHPQITTPASKVGEKREARCRGAREGSAGGVRVQFYLCSTRIRIRKQGRGVRLIDLKSLNITNAGEK